MGMFDTIHHKINCPKCNEPVIIEEQIKWADCLLRDLKVGDRVDARDGEYTYATFARPELVTECKKCHEKIRYKIIVKYGIIDEIRIDDNGELKDTIDDRSVIEEYQLIVKISDNQECAKYNPLGLCYVDDCMSCPNSKIKIIRKDDGVVLRNDFKDGKNVLRDDKIRRFKRVFEKEGISLFETMYKKKFTKFQSWYLNRIFSKLINNTNKKDNVSYE